jgi:hypothetical protein
MGISKLGVAARAAYYAERREHVNQWDSVAGAVVAADRERIAEAARLVIRDYQASDDEDLDELVQRAVRDLCRRLDVEL